MKRIIIAGTHSGCGKTTVACAVLAALKKRGMRLSAFKCGPDYIDPMFHRKVIGVPSYNLDSFLCNDDTLRYLLYVNSKDRDISVIEGVMGFYDGAGERGCAYSLSRITDTPVVIVIDCKGMSESIGAVMKGFLEYRRPNNIIGFIFNRLPERLIALAERLCSELGTQCLGYLPKTDITVKSRHLGLVTADEIPDIKLSLSRLGELAEEHINLDAIMQLSEREIPGFTAPVINDTTKRPVIAVARDKAFCFIYDDNIDLLKRLGCEIRYFSPLSDSHIPDDADGLILCGGYPELHAGELSENTEMSYHIRNVINAGMPVIAECGGFIYLHDTFTDMDGSEFPGVGTIHGKAYRTQKLQRFGYVTLTAKTDSMLWKQGDRFPAHEFHYFDSTDCGSDLTAEKTDGRKWECGHTTETMYAGFAHLYFYSDIRTAERFVTACIRYKEKYGKDQRNNTAR